MAAFQIIEENFAGKTQYFDYCVSSDTRRKLSKRAAMLELPKMQCICDLGHTKIWAYK